MRLLRGIGAAMRDAEPEAALGVAMKMLREYLGATRCKCGDVTNERWDVVLDAVSGAPPVAVQFCVADLGVSVIASLRRSGEAVVVRDILDELSPPEAKPYEAIGVRAFICCGLVRSGILQSFVAIEETTPRDWTFDEIALVEEVAERCWSLAALRSAEARIRTNEELFRLAGSTAHVGEWTMDLESGRVDLSDEICKVMGVASGARPELPDGIAFYAPEYQGLARERVAECARNGTPFDFEAQIVSTTRRQTWVRVVGQCERAPDGRIVRLRGAFQDIDDRKRLEEQFRQAQKMEAVGQLAAGIAHDFNNLLTVVISYAQMIESSLEPQHPLRVEVEEILTAGIRATDLTQQLLAFSRRQAPDGRVLDLNTKIAAMQRMLRRLLGADITLAVDLESGIGSVRVDAGQIEQIVMNLALNARDAMEGGGTLTLATRNAEVTGSGAAEHDGLVAGAYVVLSAADSGAGMDRTTQAQMFEPFFTTKKDGKGTGLGLATVFGIVKQGGGYIMVRSEVGKGTSFEIYLPRVREAPVQMEQQLPDVDRGVGTILLVEDDDAVRHVAHGILAQHGYRVLESSNADDALHIFEEHEDIDLLLTDVILPRMSGQLLARRVAKRRPSVKILFMSGYTDDVIIERGVLDAGVAYLQKPFTPVSLSRKVRDVLNPRKMSA